MGNYPPNSEPLESEREKKIQILKEVLNNYLAENVKRMVRMPTYVTYDLVHAGYPKLGEESAIIELEDALREFFSVADDKDLGMRFKILNHGPYQATYEYLRNFGETGLDDKKHQELAEDLIKLVIGRFEDEKRYSSLAHEYELMGNKKMVAEMRANPDYNEEEPWQLRPYNMEDYTNFNRTILKIKEKYQDYPVMTQEERELAIDNLKSKIEEEINHLEQT